MFAVMTIGCLLCITALSFLLSGEIFSHSIKKSARKKMLGINLVVTVLFFCFISRYFNKRFWGSSNRNNHIMVYVTDFPDNLSCYN